MARHHTFARNARAPHTPWLSLLSGVVSENVIDAMVVAHRQLDKIGVPHALVGGLAVGAYGYVRATKDVDFLVTDDAFVVHSGGLVTIQTGVPIQVGTVPIDLLSQSRGETALDGAIRDASETGGILIVPLDCLIYLKLKSPRSKDFADIVELLKVGHDIDTIRGLIGTNAPHLIAKLDKAIAEARAEGDE
jgi:hypothetical protein